MISAQLLFSLGFSFIAGLAIGYLSKLMFKIFLIIFAIALLSVLTLQYHGLINQINWPDVSGLYDQFMAYTLENSQAFRTFIIQQLPVAASTIIGLYTGWTWGR